MATTNFSEVVLTVREALGRKSGVKNWRQICEEKGAKGFQLVGVCSVPKMSKDYEEVRAKFLRSLDDMQRQIFAALEHPSAIMLMFQQVGEVDTGHVEVSSDQDTPSDATSTPAHATDGEPSNGKSVHEDPTVEVPALTNAEVIAASGDKAIS